MEEGDRLEDRSTQAMSLITAWIMLGIEGKEGG